MAFFKIRRRFPLAAALAVVFVFFPDPVHCSAATTTFTFTNRCGETVWPGVLANSGSAALETTGFALNSGDTRSLSAPSGWSGRFWGRTGCSFDGSGHGSCSTGDCGSGEVECNGAGAAPPATLIEFTLDGSGGKDYYDVSLVDGYNLPVVVEASAASGCPSTGCLVDLNARCPAELRVGSGDACRSACEAFGRPEYCCSGAYGNPNTCRPSAYSEVFKAACPRSYSYAYDDATSTFTCAAGSTGYAITFCPSGDFASSSTPATPSSKKIKNPSPRPSDAQLEDDAWLASLATGDASRVTRSSSMSPLLLAFMAVLSICWITVVVTV